MPLSLVIARTCGSEVPGKVKVSHFNKNRNEEGLDLLRVTLKDSGFREKENGSVFL